MRNGNQVITHHVAANHGEKIQAVIENVSQGEGRYEFNNRVDAGEIVEEYRLTSGYKNTYGRLL